MEVERMFDGGALWATMEMNRQMTETAIREIERDYKRKTRKKSSRKHTRKHSRKHGRRRRKACQR